MMSRSFSAMAVGALWLSLMALVACSNPQEQQQRQQQFQQAQMQKMLRAYQKLAHERQLAQLKHPDQPGVARPSHMSGMSGSPPMGSAGHHAGSDAPLTPSECKQLVERSLSNLLFAKNSVPNSPLEARMVASCTAGQGIFKRSYYDCVLADKYSDSQDCAYAAKGIDRSKGNPVLAARHVGDYGRYESAVKEVTTAVYRGKDPRTTIDQITLNSYLDRRDNVYRSLHEMPPGDRDTPLRTSASSVSENGQTYWVVREDFIELRLVKIMREDAVGTDTVTCAHYGSGARLRIDRGFCAALIAHNLHVALPDRDN